MSIVVRAARVPLVALVLWAALAVLAPLAMARYDPYLVTGGPGAVCPRAAPPGAIVGLPRSTCGLPLTDLYDKPLPVLIADAGIRSAVLLVGAAAIALTLGAFIGAAAGAMRRRALASGGVLAVT
ncbi:MAG: hypothetical protein ACRDF9_12800, partial [Candidatus Limnocylindria bacterium]